MSTPILPFAVWAAGTNQASIPANDNSLRNQILNGLVISKSVTAQPGSPDDGDIYILAATHTGSQWASFAEDDLVIFSDGTWYALAPVDGVVVNFNGEQQQWTSGGGWDVISGGGGGGGGGSSDPGVSLAWFDVTEFGATGNGSTDDTGAIQDAIDAAEAAGGGVVYFPRGVYVVNGALQDTSRSNTQLLLPIRDYVDTEQITIELRGEFAPPPIFSVVGATPLPDGHSVIKGTLNTGSGTAPGLLGAHGPSGTFSNFTNLHLIVRNLTFRMPSNPVLTACDFSKVASVDLDSVTVDCGNYYVEGLTEPTTSTSYGIRMPSNSNGANSVIGTANVIGFYKGWEFAEHCNGRNVNAWGCKQAFAFVAADHASIFQRMMAVHCERVLVATGGAHYVNIDELDIEHATTGWWVTDFDIDDASNFLNGDMNWHVVLAGTGVDATFTINGGTKLRRKRAGSDKVVVLTDGANIATNCNLADNFRVVLAGNRTLDNPTNMQDGAVYNWRVHQDGTGSRTLAYGSKFKFAGGTPTLSTTASAKDFISCQYDATDDTLYCALAKAMA